jgi:hypothetical protein
MHCDACNQCCRKLRRKITSVARAMAQVVSCRSHHFSPNTTHLRFVLALGLSFPRALWFSRVFIPAVRRSVSSVANAVQS